MNIVTLQGNLGDDPKVFTSAQGLAIASFTIATTKKSKDKDPVTQWHNCSAFGRTAESIVNTLKKGSYVMLTGEIQYQKYEKDGQTKTSTKIIVNNIAVTLQKPREDAQHKGTIDNSAHVSGAQKSSYSAARDGAYKSMASYDLEDDVPF